VQAFLAKVVDLRNAGWKRGRMGFSTQKSDITFRPKSRTASAEDLVASVLVPELGCIRLPWFLREETIRHASAPKSTAPTPVRYTYEFDSHRLPVEEIGSYAIENEAISSCTAQRAHES
jgi:hypothetical protein